RHHVTLIVGRGSQRGGAGGRLLGRRLGANRPVSELVGGLVESALDPGLACGLGLIPAGLPLEFVGGLVQSGAPLWGSHPSLARTLRSSEDSDWAGGHS